MSAAPPTTLWRLEVLRLVRTKRLLALLGVFVFFGLVSPFFAAYMQEILERFSGEITVTLPPPVPAEGVVQYISNAYQIGLVVVLVVAAGSLSIDAIPSLGAFLRTRASIPRLLAPRYVVTLAAGGLAFTLGMLATWYETHVLIGPLPTGGMLAGIASAWVYLAFVVAITALGTALVRGRTAAVGIAIGVLLALPVLGIIDPLSPWLPSHLVSAPDALARGAEATDYLRSVGVTVAATAGSLAAAVALLRRREL